MSQDLSIKEKQAAYHDHEASTYEDKFRISYDDRCITYALDRFRKAVPEGKVFGRILEIGAGTGFFCVNLFLGEAIGGEVHVSDISPGMLEVCRRNAKEHGLDVVARVGDAEALPYDDDSFDLVIGHAFIHHLPVPGLALREMARVLKPGGQLVIAGEPTELGDRIATVVKRGSWRAFRAATAAPGLRGLRRASIANSRDPETAILAALEHEVDLHTFRPQDVAHMADLAGLVDVRVITEELTSNWWGWAARTIEGSLRDGVVGYQWAMAMFNGYRALNWLDEKVLTHVVPDRFFYNLILTGTKPQA